MKSREEVKRAEIRFRDAVQNNSQESMTKAYNLGYADALEWVLEDDG